MDADCTQSRREDVLDQREKRWSMNSQRLEEIVAELMKPIGDVRRSFDTDLCALLEEYLTEAGLRALDASEQPGPSNVPHEYYAPVVPNFAELALLLQHSACLYGRKVDFLYQHVVNVSDSLHNSTGESSGLNDEPQAVAGVRRRRTVATVADIRVADFVPLDLETCAGARRENEPSRPPPTLPRLYLQLEPRVPTSADAQLLDYQAEPIGLLPDFNVTWRLQRGLLVEDLCQPEGFEAISLRAPPLAELQAALEAAAPPDPEPQRCSTPLPEPAQHQEDDEDLPRPLDLLDLSGILDLTPKRKERKRKRATSIDDLVGQTIKLVISTDVQSKLQVTQEFSLAKAWIRRVVDCRKRRILAMRRSLCDPSAPHLIGFTGWSQGEAAAARSIVKRSEESDDDGFFEQSSLGEEHNVDDSVQPSTQLSLYTSPQDITDGETGAAKWNEWQEQVLKRAARQEAQTVDIQATAARVLKRVCEDTESGQHDNSGSGQEGGGGPESGDGTDAGSGGALPCSRVLDLAESEAEVSRLFLATLFLANAGNVEIVQGPPLTLNSFSVRLLSTDERLYTAVTEADEQLQQQKKDEPSA